MLTSFEQMRFNPDLLELVPRSQLDADFGGDYEFSFDFETYWKQIIEYGTFYFGFGGDLIGFGSHCGITPDGARLPGCFDGPVSAGKEEL